VEFKPAPHRYLVVNRLPPLASDEDVSLGKVPSKSNCALAPPLHWHHSQVEKFHVLKGTALFTLNGAEKKSGAGEVVVIPLGEVHTFRNESEKEELEVEFGLDPGTRNDDEGYFRNTWAYRDDCRKAGISRSWPQVLLFMYYGKVVMNWPGPAFISKPLGLMLNFIGGLIIGEWILGYSHCYSEYYHPESD